MSNTVSPNVYKILGESAALFASTFAISKTPLISWLNTPTTPEGLALCTGVNACASAVTGVADQVYNRDGDASYRIAFQVVGLLSSFALLTAFAKPIAARIGMSLNPSALATLTAFHGIVKAVIYVGYTFAQSLTALKTIVNVEDMKEVPDAELGIRKKQFEEKQTDTWDSYTLNMQAQFNLKLKANGQVLLPFTSHKTDEALSKEELEIYCEGIGEKPTVEQAKVMIAHDMLPPKGCDVLPGLSPESVVVGKLSDTELRWYHSALCQKPEGLNAAQYKAFAEAFYKFDLTPPSQHFVMGTVPTSADGVTKTQANYHLYYFLIHRDEFNALEPQKQIVLNAIFEKTGSPHWDLTAPKKEELKNQPKDVLERLSFQYDVQPNLWNILPTDYQQAFNAALEKQGLPARELTTQPWSTTKKVAVYVGVPLLIVGTIFGLTWAGLALRASQVAKHDNSDDGQSSTPGPIDSETCIGEQDCTTPVVTLPATHDTSPLTSHGEQPKDTLVETEELLPTQDEATLERLMYGDPILRAAHQKFAADQEEAVRNQQNPEFEETVDLPMDNTLPLSERTIASEELDCDPYVPSEMTQQFTNASLAAMCEDGFTDTGIGCFPKDFKTPQPPVIHSDSPVMQLPVADHSDVETPLDFSLQIPFAHEFERTESGCSPLKAGNTSLVDLNPVTLQPTRPQELTDRVTVHVAPTETQATNGTVWETLSGTISSASSFWNDTVRPSIRSGFSKYIWSLDGAEVRASYNAEIAQGYQELPCGKAAFEALKEGTPISKECVEAAVAFREEVKTKYQDDSAYVQWALIQDRQLYEYHFQDAFNKGDYSGALKALWAGFEQVWETGSANPTTANLEAMGKSPESIACGAFATNKDINKQLGATVSEVDCRDALPKQARAPRGWAAPAIYIAPQALPGAYMGYKVIQKIVWPILSTLGSLLLCCRRRKKAEDLTHLWTTTNHQLSQKYYAPTAFEKVGQLNVGDAAVIRGGSHNRLSQTVSVMQNFFVDADVWQSTLKIIAYMAAAKAKSWDDVEDQSITATITKAMDDKITIAVQTTIHKAVYQTQETYDTEAALKKAAKEI